MASLCRVIPRLYRFGANRTALRIVEGTKIGQRSTSTFRPAQPTDKRASYRHEYPEPLPKPKQQYPGFTASYEEFSKYVERLLPRETVPAPPTNTLDGKPTPSGWVPPKPESTQLPYFVHRTKNYMLPIYLLAKNGESRILTKVRKVDGDIWKFEADLKKYLEENWQPNKKIRTQVHEVSSHIVVRGDCCEHVCKFLLTKGF